MTEHQDLIERLRREANIWDPSPLTDLLHEAAGRIEVLDYLMRGEERIRQAEKERMHK